jgi:hypothetical protein
VPNHYGEPPDIPVVHSPSRPEQQTAIRQAETLNREIHGFDSLGYVPPAATPTSPLQEQGTIEAIPDEESQSSSGSSHGTRAEEGVADVKMEEEDTPPSSPAAAPIPSTSTSAAQSTVRRSSRKRSRPQDDDVQEGSSSRPERVATARPKRRKPNAKPAAKEVPRSIPFKRGKSRL